MTIHRPHADVGDVADEAVVSVLPPFWSCFLSSCQANQKIYAYDLLLVEREGWLAMTIIQMELRIGMRNLICKAQVEENQTVIRNFLECVTLDQVSLIDIRTVALNERNKIPL